MIRKHIVRLPQILFSKRPVFIYAFHVALVAGSLVLGWLLRFDFSLPYRRVLLTSGLLLVVVRLITLRIFNLNHGWWHFASVSDAITILKAVSAGSVAFLALNRFLFNAVAFPRSVYFLEPVLTACFLAGGAGHVMDYTPEDFMKSGRRYDLILGANAHHSIFDYRRLLTQNGIYVIAGGAVSQIFQGMLLAPLLSRMGSKKVGFFIANINHKDLVFLKELLEAGKVVPVIDRRYPLSDVPSAIRYLEEGHAQGKIVITIEHTKEA